MSNGNGSVDKASCDRLMTDSNPFDDKKSIVDIIIHALKSDDVDVKQSALYACGGFIESVGEVNKKMQRLYYDRVWNGL